MRAECGRQRAAFTGLLGRGVTDSVAESESAHMQTQTGQNSIPCLAQQRLQRQMSLQNQKV
ncbi:cAMP-responsive element modulator-like [Balaenoptera ricei]|uniref:cAMP-responsive element modulator-like n=1 Tax=Balaenoptera ricei TaxID=2746895 RepID=UPI0028BEBF61|nr:cAMP-responsive element modulator-like [Balaenoptera ricei]